jgi:hypothetical protein
MYIPRNLTKTVLFIVSAVILLFAAPASAAVNPVSGETALLDSYHRNSVRLMTSSFGIPLYLESFEKGDRVHVDVYGIFNNRFSTVANVLKIPANWCDIVSLHPNVKACTYGGQPGAGLLTFYIGSKNYQSPENARQVVYHYRHVAQTTRYLDILLNAEEGPFGTNNHKMRFEALPLDGGKTFVHVSYEYSDSAAIRLAGKAYFATLGKGKAGFTVTGTDKNGKPVYVGGPRGALERNAVRYYFAIQSFLSPLRYQETKRFSMRISQWYDLTSRYKKQLIEQNKKEYIASKTIEHKNQLMLQSRIALTPSP